MAGAFARSWEMTKLSFNVMKADKELLLFPLLGGLFSILFIIAMMFPAILAWFGSGIGLIFDAFYFLIIFIIYMGLAFIATFFNVCVVYTTKTRFEGKNATFGESIRFAFSKIHLILIWSIVAATVGIILRIIENSAKKLGVVGKFIVKILVSLLGAAWSIIVIFVVPAMVFENVGPIDAIKKSIETLKKTWGESLIKYVGFSIVQALLIFIGIIVFLLLLLVSIALNAGIFVIGAVIIFAVVYFLAVVIFFNVANAIFNTTLYIYASTGKVPQGFNEDTLKTAFAGKK